MHFLPWSRLPLYKSWHIILLDGISSRWYKPNLIFIIAWWIQVFPLFCFDFQIAGISLHDRNRVKKALDWVRKNKGRKVKEEMSAFLQYTNHRQRAETPVHQSINQSPRNVINHSWELSVRRRKLHGTRKMPLPQQLLFYVTSLPQKGLVPPLPMGELVVVRLTNPIESSDMLRWCCEEVCVCLCAGDGGVVVRVILLSCLMVVDDDDDDRRGLHTSLR